MLDIETLGNSHNAVIVSIAAAQFDPHGSGTIAEFSINVNPADAQSRGLTIDASTVMWWLTQSDAARRSITGGDALDFALAALAEFVINIEAKFGGRVIVWANSPAFDIAIINSALKAVQHEPIFEFRNERDFRTISQLFPEIAKAHVREGTAHEAISDVRNQVIILQKCFEKITTGIQFS